jgi:methionine-rich copper-binding protein CopC
MRRAFVGLLVITVAIAGLSMWTGASATESVHLRLTKSSPAKDDSLTESPTSIRLWFSLEPERSISRITVTAADGTEIVTGKVEAQPENVIAAALPEVLGPGSYEVSWRTSSGDGHPIAGTFAFSVGSTR